MRLMPTVGHRKTRQSNIPVAKNSSSNKVVSSRVIEDGSFLRLKDIDAGLYFAEESA